MLYFAVLCRVMLIYTTLFHHKYDMVDMLTRAYLVYVRPLLEVNSVIWSPRYKQDIDLIERVTPSDNTHRTRDSQQTVCCESRVP